MNTIYKKRSGTSGISGQLYETKLISLLYFRLITDSNVEDFYLASNMDEIGAFDDICIKIKIKGLKRPVVIFIQVKHKDDNEKLVTIDKNIDLVKWSQSMLRIRQKLNSEKSTQHLFDGTNNDPECEFILYTNANYSLDPHKEYKSELATHLNNLLATRNICGFRPLYSEKDVEILSEKIAKDEIVTLAEHFSKYLYEQGKKSMDIMNDEFILRYHVILAMRVVQVSNIHYDEEKSDAKWRELKFRSEFFSTNDNYLQIFKSQVYKNVFNYYAKLKKKDIIESIWNLSILESKRQEPISPTTIERYVDDNQLEYTSQSQELQMQEQQKSMPLQIMDEAKEKIVRNILLAYKTKVPVAFGNVDLAIRGSAKKITNRLDYLTKVIVDLCHKSIKYGPYKIITIDETFEEGLLSSNGGLGGIVGNVLHFDETNKLLKFSDNDVSLQENAKILYSKLKSKIVNLHEYRWDVKCLRFPKLSFDHTQVSRDFFTNLIVYAKQSNHYEIEDILKHEINALNNTNSCVAVNNESVFLYYHNEIQKWWMSPKTGMYLTKANDVYKQSINNILREPQMSGLQNTYHINKIRNIAFSFTENAIQSLSTFNKNSNTIIVTNVTTLTTVKVIQNLRNINKHKYAILDIEIIMKMPAKDFIALKEELRNTEKITIVVFDIIQNNNLYRRLDALLDVIEDKHIILIIHSTIVEVIKEYFSCSDYYTINDQLNLYDLTLDSQLDIIKNTKVLFQGTELALDLLMDNTSMAFINGSVLQKIFSNETLIIGNTLTNLNYENIKHLYIERRVSPASDNEYNTQHETEHEVKSLFDINNDIVLITAKPGMGKSTLLTHLSLKTKEIDRTVWIVRINLLEHSKKFYKWQTKRTLITTLKAVKFLCYDLIKNNDLKIHLKESNNMIYLENPNCEAWETFELNLFLHFYNKGRVILLFDGFDEICPHYKDSILKFLHIIGNYPQRKKMWVTSRPNSDILPDLKTVLGSPYEIGYLNDVEQEAYLTKIWHTKLEFDKLSKYQLNNVISYMNYIKNKRESMQTSDALNCKFFKIHYIFFKYLFVNALNLGLLRIGNERLSETYIYYDYHKNIYSCFIHAQQLHGRIDSLNPESDALFGTPLLLYLLADYFANLVLNKESAIKWELSINIHSIYEMFVISKLKTILYQEKNKMDVYNPQIMITYEKERKDCLEKHKKIAAYMLLGSPIFSGLNFDEFKDMDPLNDGSSNSYEDMINSIKSGTEKTGIISYVTADNIPIFIHRTFLEYFVAEYLCDIFKSDKHQFDNKKLLYTTLNIRHMNDIMPWIHKKGEIDEDLNDIIMKILNNLPALFPTRFELFRLLRGILNNQNFSLEQHIRLMNSNEDNYLVDIRYLRTKRHIIEAMEPNLKKYFTPLLQVTDSNNIININDSSTRCGTVSSRSSRSSRWQRYCGCLSTMATLFNRVFKSG